VIDSRLSLLAADAQHRFPWASSSVACCLPAQNLRDQPDKRDSDNDIRYGEEKPDAKAGRHKPECASERRPERPAYGPDRGPPNAAGRG
jgi:hypothetical protein